MHKIIAIGPREQDFIYTHDFFSGSITLYGSNSGSNLSYCGEKKQRINHNIFSKSQGEFVEQNMLKMIEEDQDIRFMSYDPNQAYDCDPKIIERTVCLNDKDLMDKLNCKISFRKWAENICRVQHSDLLLGSQCTFQYLKKRYNQYDSFIIQKALATGGEGTYLLTEQNTYLIGDMLEESERYLVSGYEEHNIPVNIHAIIYEKDILIFPPSIQIMRKQGVKLLYQGADFNECARLTSQTEGELRTFMWNICIQLQKEGYRGITGVDAMIVDNKVYILEMNNRFQGSTVLLNIALADQGFPSMQELNYDSFINAESKYDVRSLKIPYSCFTYLADEKGMPYRGHRRDFKQEKNVYDIYDDGLNYEWKIAPFATLERVVFKTNIVSITDENRVNIHPNIPDMDNNWFYEITQNHNLLYLKIALINQGIVIKDDAKNYLLKNGGMRKGVYNAVDIYMDDIVINSAVSVKFTSLSPFNIRTGEDDLILYCCDIPIKQINIQKADVLGERLTSSGTRVKDICLLATDRVRIQHSTNCHFTRCGVGCRFCEVEDHEFSFTMKDIFEAVDLYIDSQYKFRHFLIGGRSDSASREIEEILMITDHINKRGSWPIYVMCVPPRNKEDLKQLYDNHVTEIALNIEIWDRKLAEKWMPGKGKISRSRYMEMLEYATQLWGTKGDVRTAFIVGLESSHSLLSGVEEVCKLGVAPILSVFRPIPGTEGENLTPPSNELLLEIYQRAENICEKYGLRLGPSCIPCQNNTLSIPSNLCS